MKRKAFIVLTAAALVASVFAFVPTPQTASADCISQSGNGDTDVFIGPFSMSAGGWVTVTMTAGESLRPQGPAAFGGTAIVLVVGGIPDIHVEYAETHTVTFTFDEDTTDILLVLDWEYPGDPANTYVVTSSDCGGCDTMLTIPSTAVGGTFTLNSELYWAPGEMTSPPIIMEAGKNVRVIGLDASGQYYKVLFACTFAWARSETLGPNFDPPWNGLPLPTVVVK